MFKGGSDLVYCKAAGHHNNLQKNLIIKATKYFLLLLADWVREISVLRTPSVKELTCLFVFAAARKKSKAYPAKKSFEEVICKQIQGIEFILLTENGLTEISF